MDTVKRLKVLALATRLRRLSDRLSKDINILYKKMNVDFEAKWFAFMFTLNQKSPQSVTELADNLGITHTAVNQFASELMKKGYVNSVKGKTDERIRLIDITRKGDELIRTLTPIWKKIKLANEELVNKVDPGFLITLEKIEAELDKTSMFERVWYSLNNGIPGELKIIEYSSKMKKYFIKLNYEWLEEYFTVEQKDKTLLHNPKEKIINSGGNIFFALIDDNVAGTCALMKHPDGKYELAKMAVTKRYQGHGIGQKLIDAVKAKLKNSGVNELFLLTNRKLISANILYRKNGFVKLRKSPFNDEPYERETYAMRLKLDAE